MFAEKYKKAYDSITPSPEKYQEVLMCAREAQSTSGVGTGQTADVVSDTGNEDTGQNVSGVGNEDIARNISDAKDRRRVHKRFRAVRPAVAAAVVLAGILSVLPVCAANSPAFYRVVEFISPALADRLVPVEKSSTSQGITMEVEAVDLQGNEAEIIVSVRDAEDSPVDRIHGQVDLFDSYNLLDYGSELTVGGCSFLTYDEETGKAYFKITTRTSGTYRADKLCFSVREILCDKSSENREIDLTGIERPVPTRMEEINGMGGVMDEDSLPDSLAMTYGTKEDPRWQCSVMDLMRAEDCASDDFTVTGVAYMDGALRLQICMGDNRHADRHVQPFLVDAAGEEKHEDFTVSWSETVGDARYQFYEYWFIGDLEKPEEYSMYGIFHNSGESVEGQWEVTFRVA